MADIKNKQSNPVEGHGYFPNVDYSGKQYFPNSIFSKPKRKKHRKTTKKAKKVVSKRKHTTKKVKRVKTTRKPAAKTVKKVKTTKTVKPIVKVEKKPTVKIEKKKEAKLEKKQEVKKPVVSETRRFEAAKPIPPNTTNSKTKKGRIALGIVLGVVLPILLIIALLLFLSRCSKTTETTLDIRTNEQGKVVCYGFKEKATEKQILNEFKDNLVIPAVVQEIYTEAFIYDETKTRIPSQITTLTFEENSNCYCIGTSAFAFAPIENVTLPEQITTIENNAFSSSNLTKVRFPVSLSKEGSTIGEGSFTNCEKLTDFDFSEWPNLADTLANGAITPLSTRGAVWINGKMHETQKNFYWRWKAYLTEQQGFRFSRIDGWTVNPYPPREVLDIEGTDLNGFYKYAEELEIYEVLGQQLSIGKDITSVSENAFYDGGKTTIPSNMTLSFEDGRTQNLVIHKNAFTGLPGNDALTLPSYVAEVWDNAFDGSTIKSLALNPSTILYSSIFANCASLNSINLENFTAIPTESTWYGSDIFAPENKQGKGTIYVSSDSWEEIELWRNYLTNTQGFVFDSNHWKLEGHVQGTVLDIRDNVLYGFVEGATEEEIIAEFGNEILIPEGVTEVANEAFMNDWYSETKVVIPENITKITFAKPENIQKIGDKAFAFNQNIKQININELSSLKTIGDYAFVGCSSLTKFDRNGQTNTLSLVDNMSNIGTCAFYGCSNIEGIKLPLITNETQVGEFAFATGGNKLKNIDFSKLTIVVNEAQTEYDSCSMKTWMNKANQGLFVDVAAEGTIKLPQYSGILSQEKAFLLADSMLEAIQNQNHSAFYWLFSKFTLEEGINLLSWTLLPN